MQITISQNRVPADLFQPDILTLDQAADQRRSDEARSPEFRLMLAVIDDALLTYRRFATAKGGLGRRRFEDVERWINSSDAEWLYSFESICEALSLEPDAVRRSLVAWRNQQRPGKRGGGSSKWRRVAGGRHTIGQRGWNLRRIG